MTGRYYPTFYYGNRALRRSPAFLQMLMKACKYNLELNTLLSVIIVEKIDIQCKNFYYYQYTDPQIAISTRYLSMHPSVMFDEVVWSAPHHHDHAMLHLLYVTNHLIVLS
jgi:hypothetical protein